MTKSKRSSTVSSKSLKKKVSSKQRSKTPKTQPRENRLQLTVRRIRAFMSRRPHRTFRRTRRRDYVRSLELPGYFAFTAYVLRTLKTRRKTVLALIGVFTLAMTLFVGLASQEAYQMLAGTLQETSTNIFTGSWGEIGKAGLLFTAIASGSIGSDLTEAQQMYGIIIFLMLWLSTVWILRSQLAGVKLRLRDAIYNSGGPIIPTMLVLALLVVQLVPAALAVVAYGAALSTNFLANGIIAMIFSLVVFMLCLLSIYWITSTLIALVVVTLPGMYPWQAVRTAGDLVIGRRLRILFRFLWLALIVALLWIVVMLPVIVLTAWLQHTVAWTVNIPIVPVILLLLGVASTVFSASYVYLLYRKVVDDDAQPA